MRKFRMCVLLLVLIATIMPVSAQDYEITLDLMTGGDSWDPDNAYEPMIEEAIQVELNFNVVPGTEYAEKRNVVMASGDYPDVIQVNPLDPTYIDYVDGGLLQPLDEWLEKYPAVRDAYTEAQWDANRASDGNIYHIPRITGFYPMAQSYRKDWTDALGIEQPTSVEEYTAMLTAFMEEDPGNLGGALIPFVPNRLDNVGWLGQIIFTAFGCNLGAWQPDPEDETRLVMGASVPACKDALNYFRGLLDDGLLDETWGVSTERGLFKFYAGIAGSTTDWPQFSHLRLEAIQSAFPDIDPAIAYITHMEGPTGIVGGPIYTPQTKAGGAAVTVAATEEEVDAFFRMLEWQYTDGYELMALGVEGITFDVGEDGIRRRRGRDAVLENNPEYDLYMLDRLFFAEPPQYFGYTRDNPSWNDVSDEMFEYVSGVLAEIEEYKVINYGVNMDHDAIRENGGPVGDIVTEFFTSAILSPGFDMDAEWENYVSQLEQAGLPAMTDAVNELNDIAEINATVGR